YAASHNAEMERLMAMADEQRAVAGVSMNPVWEGFEARAAMLEVLAQNLLPGAAKDGGQAPTPAAVAPTAPPKAPPAQPSAQGGSPLSMFAKKPADGGNAPPPAPKAPPEEKPPAKPQNNGGN